MSDGWNDVGLCPKLLLLRHSLVSIFVVSLSGSA